MNRQLIIALLASAMLGPALAQKSDPHTPKHGGIVMETKAGDLELVAKPDSMQVYVSDHGKEMKLTSGTGKVTLFNGNDKVEAPLTLAGDRLEAKGSFKVAAGTRVLVEATINGKPPVSTRFTLK